MKRIESSAFFGGVVMGVLLFAACGRGNSPPAEAAGTPVNPLQPSDATDSPPPESQTSEPTGTVQRDDAEKSPSPGGSGTPAVGYP
jgi:hypothetical protein